MAIRRCMQWDPTFRPWAQIQNLQITGYMPCLFMKYMSGRQQTSIWESLEYCSSLRKLEFFIDSRYGISKRMSMKRHDVEVVWLVGALTTSLANSGTNHLQLLVETVLRPGELSNRKSKTSAYPKYKTTWEREAAYVQEQEWNISDLRERFGGPVTTTVEFQPVVLPQNLRMIRVDARQVRLNFLMAMCLYKNNGGEFFEDRKEFHDRRQWGHDVDEEEVGPFLDKNWASALPLRWLHKSDDTEETFWNVESKRQEQRWS
ncbi:MAG: hypothetical protein Q9160_001094 [Pyrenula sp. 1 TL-2023]